MTALVIPIALLFATAMPQRPPLESGHSRSELILAQLPYLELSSQRQSALDRIHSFGCEAIPVVLDRLRNESATRTEAVVGLSLALGSLPASPKATEALAALLGSAAPETRSAAREALLGLGPRRVGFGVLDLGDNSLKWYSEEGEVLRAHFMAANAAFEIGWDERGIFSDGFSLGVLPWNAAKLESIPGRPWGRIWSFSPLIGHSCACVTDRGLVTYDLDEGTTSHLAPCPHPNRSIVCQVAPGKVLLCDSAIGSSRLVSVDPPEIVDIATPPNVVSAWPIKGSMAKVMMATPTAVYTVALAGKDPKATTLIKGLEGVRSAAALSDSRFLIAWSDHLEIRSASGGVLRSIRLQGFQALVIP